MVIRFGGISDRKADPLVILQASLRESGWRPRTLIRAGSASQGRRQALAFSQRAKDPRAEQDLWAELER
jgi:hypothetical protein